MEEWDERLIKQLGTMLISKLIKWRHAYVIYADRLHLQFPRKKNSRSGLISFKISYIRDYIRRVSHMPMKTSLALKCIYEWRVERRGTRTDVYTRIQSNDYFIIGPITVLLFSHARNSESVKALA